MEEPDTWRSFGSQHDQQKPHNKSSRAWCIQMNDFWCAWSWFTGWQHLTIYLRFGIDVVCELDLITSTVQRPRTPSYSNSIWIIWTNKGEHDISSVLGNVKSDIKQMTLFEINGSFKHDSIHNLSIIISLAETLKCHHQTGLIVLRPDLHMAPIGSPCNGASLDCWGMITCIFNCVES